MFMRRLNLSTLGFAVLALAVCATPLAAESHEAGEADPFLYTIDRSHAAIGFKVTHFTVSKVRGDFGEFSGSIRYNPDDLSESGVEVTIAATSIDTDNDQRDEHLRSPDFLEADEHPTILFKSTKVEKTDDGMMLTGELSMRGVTREVSFPFEMVGPIKDPLGLMRIGVEGELTIDRRVWGLEWNKAMETGGVIVGHDVKIELSAEAARK